MFPQGFQEGLCDHQWVAIPFTQGRHIQCDFTDPVIQVFPEIALGNQVLNIPVGGAHHPDINGNRFYRTYPVDHSFLQEAKQFGLQCHRHIANLVEKQGAAVGALNLAFLGLGRAGKGAFLEPEQFALQQVFRNGGAVDGRKGFVGAMAQVVQGPGQEFLAGTGFAGNQGGDIGRCNFFDRAANHQHFGAGGNNAFDVGAIALRGQFAVFFFQFREAECPIYHKGEDVGIQRLLVEVAGSHAYGLDGVFLVFPPSHHDHFGHGRQAKDIFQQGETLSGAAGVGWQAKIQRHHFRLETPKCR